MTKTKPKLSPTILARKSIEGHFDHKTEIPDIENFDEFLQKPAGVFVSIHKKPSKNLRGCIGTYLPTTQSAYYEIIQNAKSASFDDPRFPPLSKTELDEIEISVDILSSPSKIDSKQELDPKIFGIIVVTKDGRRGLLLPNLPGVKTSDEQISICLQKAGIFPDDKIEIEKFTVTRFS